MPGLVKIGRRWYGRWKDGCVRLWEQKPGEEKVDEAQG